MRGSFLSNLASVLCTKYYMTDCMSEKDYVFVESCKSGK